MARNWRIIRTPTRRRIRRIRSIRCRRMARNWRRIRTPTTPQHSLCGPVSILRPPLTNINLTSMLGTNVNPKPIHGTGVLGLAKNTYQIFICQRVVQNTDRSPKSTPCTHVISVTIQDTNIHSLPAFSDFDPGPDGIMECCALRSTPWSTVHQSMMPARSARLQVARKCKIIKICDDVCRVLVFFWRFVVSKYRIVVQKMYVIISHCRYEMM